MCSVNNNASLVTELNRVSMEQTLGTTLKKVEVEAIPSHDTPLSTFFHTSMLHTHYTSKELTSVQTYGAGSLCAMQTYQHS